MKLILLQDIKNVGKANQEVDVKDGYGNFLLTSGKAIKSTDKAKAILDKQVAADKAAYDAAIAKANQLKAKIENATLHFSLKTNNGQVFGSITNKQIVDELNKLGINIDKRMLVEGNKTYGLGGHKVEIKLHKQVIANLIIRVAGE